MLTQKTKDIVKATAPVLAHLSQLAGVKPAKCLIRLSTRSKVSTTSALVQQ